MPLFAKILWAVVWLGLLCRLPAAELERPHVVIILVDDMGYGDPHCYNPQSRIRTPNIDAVAAAGMRFTDAHAAGPLCHMSRYGLLTGKYPFRTDVNLWRSQPLIAGGQTTIASLLKQQGYQTAMVGKWHLGFHENGYDQPLPGGPVDVGFDSFFGIRASTDIPPYFYIRNNRAVEPPTKPIEANASPDWSPIQGAFWRDGLIAPSMQLADVLPRFTDEAISVIEKYAQVGEQDSKASDADAAQNPLFLYLAYPAPHTPWLPSAAFAGKSQVGMYGDFAEMVDAMIGRVLTSLDAAGMSQNTLLIISSDNGPVWYADDVARFQHDSCGGLRGMKADAWEAGHRMPFIARWPGVVAADSVSDQLVSFTDLLATLAAITGYELSADDGPDSFDFSAALRSQASPAAAPRQDLALQSGGGFMTLRQGDWKLIQGLGSGGFSNPKKIKPAAGAPTAQLYNLKQDPAEANDLATANPERVASMQRELARIEQAGRHRQ